MSAKQVETQIASPHPRETLSLHGHRDAEATLLNAYRSGRIPHAWLIGGAQGIGKATLAYRMARFVLAHRDLEPAGSRAHLAVHLYQRPWLEHPCEVALVEPDGAHRSRLVDDLRRHDPEVAAARRTLADRLHAAADGCDLAGLQQRDRARGGAVVTVGTRSRLEQIPEEGAPLPARRNPPRSWQ